jgi:hypothetical protein
MQSLEKLKSGYLFRRPAFLVDSVYWYSWLLDRSLQLHCFYRRDEKKAIVA